MYNYWVTCSYDEVLCFKKSAAVAAIVDPCKQGISNESQGLIQVIADNFDADICSPNGKVSTHFLAMIITETGCNDSSYIQNDIKCLQKEELKEVIDDGQSDNYMQYHGQKNPMMSKVLTKSQDSSMNAVISKRRADECDFSKMSLFVNNALNSTGTIWSFPGSRVIP